MTVAQAVKEQRLFGYGNSRPVTLTLCDTRLAAYAVTLEKPRFRTCGPMASGHMVTGGPRQAAVFAWEDRSTAPQHAVSSVVALRDAVPDPT